MRFQLHPCCHGCLLSCDLAEICTFEYGVCYSCNRLSFSDGSPCTFGFMRTTKNFAFYVVLIGFGQMIEKKCYGCVCIDCNKTVNVNMY